MEETKSCNTIVVGTVDTGKTYTTLMYANMLAHRKIEGIWRQVRPIITLDHSDNQRSYPGFEVIPMEYLQKDLDILNNPHYKKVLISVEDEAEIEEFNKYLIHFQTDAVVNYDDIGFYFTGNITNLETGFKVTKTPKNNGLDIIYQFHSWEEIAPALRAVASVFIVKETPDVNISKLDRLPMKKHLQVLNEEVIRENETRPSGKKYATRILDVKFGKVTVMDFNNNFTTHSVYDYFKGKIK